MSASPLASEPIHILGGGVQHQVHLRIPLTCGLEGLLVLLLLLGHLSNASLSLAGDDTTLNIVSGSACW